MSGTGATSRIPELDPARQAVFTAGVPPVPARTFELGLVLGGTVSAGAYTAGALDLLVQALDGYAATFDDAPPHAVKLRLAAGSSGGAVCASILGVSLNRSFTHLSGGAADLTQTALNVEGAGPGDNKLWDLWVNQFHFLPMLDTDDLGAVIADPPGSIQQHVAALLNGKVIDGAVASIVHYANPPGTVARAWAASPFRVATTVCNLRGIPYKIEGVPAIGAYTGAAYIEHDDYAWFALPNVVGPDSGDDGGKRRPDEFWLSSNPKAGISVSYQTLGDYARASGAMPVGLPARPLSRPAEHYLYRPHARVDDQGAVQIAWSTPDFSELGDVAHGLPYGFTGVDGGTLNNDPVKIAHQAMTGIGFQNPRAPSLANRGLFLIDPLADQPGPIAGVGLSLLAAVGALVGNFVGGARYLTADLDLFQAQDVFSRFQLVPTRTGLDGRAFPGDLARPDTNGAPAMGEAALAGTDLMALGGWCARPFRVHDFLLGRLNMAAYLRREFLLTGDNPVFDGWTFDQRADVCCDASGTRLAIMPQTPPKSYWMPIIPLPPDNFGVVPPAWPKAALDADAMQQIHDAIDARAKAVVGKLRADNVPGFGPWLLSLLILGTISDTVADDVVKGLTNSLTARNLM